MESINFNIDDGRKKIILNGDENKVLVFNPNDIATRKKFYDSNNKILEYDKKFQEEVKKIKEEKNEERVFQLEEEMYDFIKNLIDYIFCDGIADMITDGKKNVVALMNFMTAITPYFVNSVKSKRDKYINNKSNGVL